MKALLEERTSALVEALDAVKASGEECQEIIEHMPLAFLSLDPGLRVLTCNRAAAQLLGVGQEELVGRKLWPSYQREESDGVFRKKYLEALAQNKSVSFQAFSPVVRKWLDARAYPSSGRLLVYLRDITKEKNQDDISAKLWKDYRSLADNAPDLILRFNETLRCTFANREFQRLMGIGPLHFIGKSIGEVGLPQETAERLKSARRTVFRRGPWHRSI